MPERKWPLCSAPCRGKCRERRSQAACLQTHQLSGSHELPAATQFRAWLQAEDAHSRICGSAESYFAHIRDSVAAGALPAAKSAMLGPLHQDLAFQLSLQLFGISDANFMRMFTGTADLAPVHMLQPPAPHTSCLP